MLRSPRLISATFSLGSRIRRPLVLHRLPLLARTRTWTSCWTLGACCPPKPLLFGPSLHQACVSCSDLASQKYTLIYAFPAIRVLRALSRLKLAQTAITMVLLPTVSFFYLQGQASFSMVTYSTTIAMFAGVMLYAISFYIQRVVGMMYLDSAHTTLKVSHLTFWGHRREMYLPVSDIMTLGDTGDSPSEIILRLKCYSSPKTLYFSTRLGHVVDRKTFEKIFGTL